MIDFSNPFQRGPVIAGPKEIAAAIKTSQFAVKHFQTISEERKRQLQEAAQKSGREFSGSNAVKLSWETIQEGADKLVAREFVFSQDGACFQIFQDVFLGQGTGRKVCLAVVVAAGSTSLQVGSTLAAIQQIGMADGDSISREILAARVVKSLDVKGVMASHATVGWTLSSRTFFMEIVDFADRGSITKYAEECPNEGSIEARFYEMACQLVALHEKGYLHRDIKPDNLLVRTLEGIPHGMVCDFEASAPTLVSENEEEENLFQETTTTPFFADPEYSQALVERGDKKAGSCRAEGLDVWAFSLSMYFILSKTDVNKAAQHTSRCATAKGQTLSSYIASIKDISELGIDLSKIKNEKFREAIAKGLALKRTDRISMKEMVQLLAVAHQEVPAICQKTLAFEQPKAPLIRMSQLASSVRRAVLFIFEQIWTWFSMLFRSGYQLAYQKVHI